MATAAVLSALAGFLIYRLLMRPMAGHPIFAAVLVTVTLGILLRAAIVLVYTDRIRHPLPLLGLTNPPRRLPGGAVVSTFDLLTVGAAAALFLALFAFLRLSPLGIQMRAAGEKALLAAQRGINFQLLFALSWALAGFAGALAGMLYANNVRLDPSLGVLGLKAFAVALVGGLDSLGGVIPARAHRGRRRGAVRPLRRPAAGRRLAVPLPARDAARASVGPLRDARKSWSACGRPWIDAGEVHITASGDDHASPRPPGWPTRPRRSFPTRRAVSRSGLGLSRRSLRVVGAILSATLRRSIASRYR